MRKLFVCAAALVTIGLAIGGAAAGPLPALTTAPTNFTCSVVDTSVECSWDALEGASKYSVDVVANYMLADGITTTSADFDFGTTLTSISIPLDTFPPDIDQNTFADTLTSLVLPGERAQSAWKEGLQPGHPVQLDHHLRRGQLRPGDLS